MEKNWEVIQVFADPELTLSTVEVFAAQIQPKFASTLVRKLNLCEPLPSLGHLKRVRKRSHEGEVQLSIILCLVPCEGGEWSPSKAPPEVLKLVEEHKLTPFIATVSKHEPCSRDEWEEQCHLWPTSYHPNAVNSRQVVTFEKSQVEDIHKFMSAAIGQAQLAAKAGQPPNGAVIVDPVAGLILSAAHDETGGWINARSVSEAQQQLCCSGNAKVELSKQILPWHPLRHAVMVAIERAAEKNITVRGNMSDDAISSRVNSKRMRTDETLDNMERPKNLNEHYLCTGFDVYVTREPCSMCAMALLHQRVHRVFYGSPNQQVGALSGVHKLHGKQGLNHHYLVFQVSLSEKDIL